MKTKIITLISSLFLLQAAFAADCKCKPDDLKNLKKDLATSKSAFIGHLRDNSINVDRAWTKNPNNYKLADKAVSDCSIKLEPSKRYLIVGTNPENVSVCNTLAYELATAQKELSQVGPRKPEQGFNPGWYICYKDADCVVKQDGCGQSIGIGKGFGELFSKFSKPAASSVKCPPAKKLSKAVCTMNLCGAI